MASLLSQDNLRRQWSFFSPRPKAENQAPPSAFFTRQAFLQPWLNTIHTRIYMCSRARFIYIYIYMSIYMQVCMIE